MARAQFTAWPWGTLALLMPVVAAASAGLAAHYEHSFSESITIFFLIIAAGNAYLFATAIGDFRRSIIAIPIGAASALFAVNLFADPFLNAVFLVCLSGVVLSYVACNEAGPLSLIAGLQMPLLAFFIVMSYSSDPVLCLVCTYPFICACVTASMAVEPEPRKIFAAAAAGILGSVPGLFLGGFSALGIKFSIQLCYPLIAELGWVVALGGGFSLANYICVSIVFESIHRGARVEPEATDGINNEMVVPIELSEEKNSIE